MPKNKKLEDSDSDSGPEDRNPPPQKKKAKGSDDNEDKGKNDSTKTDDQGNQYWELDRNRRVSLSSFKGKQYLNIREYYLDKSSGQWRPGKSGITLTKKEWSQLLELQPQIKFDN
ncbi:hypothetical protein PVAND_017459 [Polypedilum vanderplanki]|uniref:Transcriptional coactivator p15 (PC4) C-terminal domain-containing protein n=1 Tax=Polypedilum vanderplanki TaxID=319348 RepID=A0A9J6BIC4_POLVA|nr:hypothetical protein PVAND_017459 [Polypedilum vanderplanki]